MTKLILNAVRIRPAEGRHLLVGVQPYDRETLAGLRRERAGQYFFRRGGVGGRGIPSGPFDAAPGVQSGQERIWKWHPRLYCCWYWPS